MDTDLFRLFAVILRSLIIVDVLVTLEKFILSIRSSPFTARNLFTRLF